MAHTKYCSWNVSKRNSETAVSAFHQLSTQSCLWHIVALSLQVRWVLATAPSSTASLLWLRWNLKDHRRWKSGSIFIGELPSMAATVMGTWQAKTNNFFAEIFDAKATSTAELLPTAMLCGWWSCCTCFGRNLDRWDEDNDVLLQVMCGGGIVASTI